MKLLFKKITSFFQGVEHLPDVYALELVPYSSHV
jgi:hypothetical protein